MDGRQVARSLNGYTAILREATDAVNASGIQYLVFGSIATRALGRPRPISADEDIDLFVRPPDAPGALEALGTHGFVTIEDDPSWIFKARRGAVTVDVIFKAAGRVYMDDEMFERGRDTAVLGVPVRLLPAEDLLVIKAILHDEERAFDWFDAVSLLERDDLDWEYLVRRGQAYGTQRLLSLLLFADSAGLPVPGSAVETLRDSAQG